MHLGDVINKYRMEHGKMSMQAFANKCGLSKGYIAMLERNVNSKTGEPVVPSLETFVKVASAMNVSLNSLMNEVDENQPISLAKGTNISQQSEISDIKTFDNLYPIEVHKYPMLGEIACGEPIFVNEERESYVLSGTKIDADFCLKAKGDSMIGARILDGDIVFIKETTMVENGDIAAVAINDEVLLKRFDYLKEENILALHSENPRYKTMRFSGEELDHIRVLGKAVAFQSDII